jgi:signal transduction histidine kinase
MVLNPVKVLREITSLDYSNRRIFTAKLRIVIFIGFWCIYLLLLKNQLGKVMPVTVIILVGSVATIFCYFNYHRRILRLSTIAIQIFADLIGLTSMVYLTGGPESEYYIVYIFYVLAAGIFYNYRLATLIALLSLLIYSLFLICTYAGLIPPLHIQFSTANLLETDFPYIRLLLLILFVALAVYATKIAHHFSQKRERVLEERNKELIALQQMSSTIRTFGSLDNVLTKVVNGVLVGLDFEMCLLMLYDKSEKRVRCIAPDNVKAASLIEKEVGLNLNKLFFDMESIVENEAFKQLEEGKIIFRSNLSELLMGFKPELNEEKIRIVQEKLRVQRVVAIPLVTSREVIGALVGLSSEAFVEDQKVSTFQAFADQASLTVEAAILISELKKKNIALIEAVRFKSEFLATMSHELRTPLTAIIGFSELMVEEVMGVLNDEQRDSIKEVLMNANNLLEMINNLLDLAKADFGKMELNRRNFDWGEMLRAIERSLAPLIKKKSQSLTINVVPNIPEIFADEKRMQQIVLNLIGNAIKFTPKGGEIKVAAEIFLKSDKFGKKYKVDLKSKRDKEVFKNGVMVCSVADTGIGILDTNIHTIFDVFRQVDSSETKSYEGSGLGLALVKQFVEMHDGLVWVESKAGVGTKFTFAIPVG